MYSVATLALIVFGFGVLIVTFLWIAKLLARRRAKPEGDHHTRAEPESTRPGEEVEEASPTSAMIHGANYGLVLGVLSCLLFTVVPPMMLILSAAGILYSSKALWQGVSRYRMIVFRALVGLVLSSGSVGLTYLHLTIDFPTGIIPSDLLRGIL